jgi:hypothetical protein
VAFAAAAAFVAPVAISTTTSIRRPLRAKTCRIKSPSHHLSRLIGDSPRCEIGRCQGVAGGLVTVPLSFNTISGIVPRIAIHSDAVDDLQSIKARGEHADHGAILAFLQQAQADPAVLETLSEHWFGEDGSANYTVQKITSLHRKGKRLWRVKVLSLKGLVARYRVLYAFDPRVQIFYVLGIPSREVAYDENDPRIRRLIAVYDTLNIP